MNVHMGYFRPRKSELNWLRNTICSTSARLSPNIKPSALGLTLPMATEGVSGNRTMGIFTRRGFSNGMIIESSLASPLPAVSTPEPHPWAASHPTRLQNRPSSVARLCCPSYRKPLLPVEEDVGPEATCESGMWEGTQFTFFASRFYGGTAAGT